eukprot:CAMPEP_0116027184 /NCGR_PEP_ID=MMETSP0321-20121206/14453_1 /TAXON_ID=163516 /ORGANISM="Leptocylindrus danicus var. danicus, Strain B650" /LENGTH=257 /DNA_ID=CAMNT_0003500441 /DNA_START=153 /DNA_END=923 /DNA_ORIENTATION=-
MKVLRLLTSCIPKKIKKKNSSKERDDNIKSDRLLLPHIPTEVVANIFSCLGFEEVGQYVWVSRTWMNAAPRITSTGILLDKQRGDHKLKSALTCFGSNLISVYFKCAAGYEVNAKHLACFLHNVPKITRFGFEGRYRYYHASSFLEPLVEADGLESLKLAQCAFSDVQALIRLLEHKANLKVLHLNHIHIGGAYFPGPKDCAQLTKQLKKLQNLEELDLSCGWRKDLFSKDDLRSKLPRLQKVNIDSNHSVSLKSAW